MRNVSSIESQASALGDGEIDLGGVGRALLRRRATIGALTLLALCGSSAFVTLVKPRYTAEVKALIENQETFFTRPGQDKGGGDGGGLGADPEAVGSQALVVTSRDLARQAIAALDLRNHAEFNAPASTIPLLGPLFSMFSAPPAPDGAEDRVMEAYFDHLNVFPVARSRVLQIEFSDRDPDFAARAANTIADLYIGVQSTQKRASAGLAASSLATLIADLRGKVADADRKADEFRAANGLLLGANNVSVSGQQVTEIGTQIAQARAAQADAQAKSRLIREMLRQGRIGEVPDVASNELIRRLSEQRSTLRSQLAAEGRTLLPGHPRIKELTAQLTEIESNIRAQAEKTARTLENEAKIAGSRLQNLRADFDDQKKVVGGSSGEEARARELDREARLLKEQLESSTTKYQEALARQAADSTPSDARIISRATAPSLPTFPRKLPIIVFATLATLLLAAGTVVAGELLSGRAYLQPAFAGHAEPHGAHAGQIFEPRISELQPAVKIAPDSPPLRREVEHSGDTQSGDTTVSPRRALADIISDATSTPAPAAEDAAAVRALAENLARREVAGIALRVWVSGATPQVDCAREAVALGRVAALDRRAILVEIGNPAGVEAGAGDGGPVGLGELLRGQADFEAVIHRDRGSRLHLLPAGRAGVGSLENFDAVIAALEQTYDYLILVASGEPLADVAQFVGRVDTCVLICAPARFEADNAAAYQQLVDAGAHDILAVAPYEPPSQPSRQSGQHAA